MSNCVEHLLGEVAVSAPLVRELVGAVLHTILFCRAPGPCRPSTGHAEHFGVAFARCSDLSITRAVDTAVDQLLTGKLVAAGPELSKGGLVLSFFERRTTTALFGLVSNEERVVWEQWVLPVLVDHTPQATSDDTASSLERARLKDEGEALLRQRISDVFEAVGASTDHVPPVMYEFQLDAGPEEARESLYSRVVQTPKLLDVSV